MRLVSPEEARRIAIRSQLLDGSATSVLDTVRQLGFLQIDPISTVAPPQHLVLWSRLGAGYDRAELDRRRHRQRRQAGEPLLRLTERGCGRAFAARPPPEA